MGRRKKFDPVRKPAHYAQFSIEPLDAIEAWRLGHHAANVVKYLVRAPHKGTEIQDMSKARMYLDRLIEMRRKEIAGERPGVRGGVWKKRNEALREAAGAIWSEIFKEAFPEGVEVRWVPHLPGQMANATVGGACHGGEVLLDWGKFREERWPFAILVHELYHLRNFDHGKEFQKRLRPTLRKYGLPEEYAAAAY